jgi:hypothetical protein
VARNTNFEAYYAFFSGLPIVSALIGPSILLSTLSQTSSGLPLIRETDFINRSSITQRILGSNFATDIGSELRQSIMVTEPLKMRAEPPLETNISNSIPQLMDKYSAL